MKGLAKVLFIEYVDIALCFVDRLLVSSLDCNPSGWYYPTLRGSRVFRSKSRCVFV